MDDCELSRADCATVISSCKGHNNIHGRLWKGMTLVMPTKSPETWGFSPRGTAFRRKEF